MEALRERIIGGKVSGSELRRFMTDREILVDERWDPKFSMKASHLGISSGCFFSYACIANRYLKYNDMTVSDIGNKELSILSDIRSYDPAVKKWVLLSLALITRHPKFVRRVSLSFIDTSDFPNDGVVNPDYDVMFIAQHAYQLYLAVNSGDCQSIVRLENALKEEFGL
jgi:hypothetical protein